MCCSWNLQPWYLHSVIKQGDQRLSGIEVEDHIEVQLPLFYAASPDKWRSVHLD